MSVFTEPMKLSLLQRQMLVIFGSTLILLLLIIGLAIKSLVDYQNSTLWVNHTHEVLKGLDAIQYDVVEAQGYQRTYLITGDRRSLESFKESLTRLNADQNVVYDLIKDNPTQVRTMRLLREYTQQRVNVLEQGISLFQNEGYASSVRLVRTGVGRNYYINIRAQLDQMKAVESDLLQQRNQELDQSARNVIVSLIVTVSMTFLLLSLAYRLISKEMHHRLKAEEETTRLNEKLADQVQVLASEVKERQAAESKVSELNAHLAQRVEEINAANSHLNAVNKELEAFCYSVSHDLRAPLRTIDGFSQAVMQMYGDRLDDEGRDFLERVCAGSRQMGQLIDDLLQLSRLTRSEVNMEPNVNLSEMGRGIIDELHRLEPDHALNVDIEPNMVVRADKRLLQAVLQNLLGNAWKFTSKKPDAKITLASTEQDGKRVYYVRDNGVGFDMAYVHKLFGAFQRLHSVQDFPGTGVGLATVQRIIHRHGGTIWAEGAVGEGATFYFTLPTEN